MLANYGYEDGSGTYYITIDTSKCAVCTEKSCIKVCPEKLFIGELDDFDEEVVVIREDSRNTLLTNCAYCKANGEKEPCRIACKADAISFSW